MYARFDYTMANCEPIHGRTVLDVGCGTGRYAMEFTRRSAREVVGTDISQQMITVCEQRAKEAGVADRCTFIKSDLLAIRPSLQHDICTGIGLFDYVRELLPLLSKMSSVIKDRAVISLPRLWTWRAPVRKVRLGLRGCDVYFYSMARTTKLLKRTRFRRYEAQRVGQFCCVTAFV